MYDLRPVKRDYKIIKQKEVKTTALKEALRDEETELMSCYVFSGKELKQYNALFGVSYGNKKIKTAKKTQAFMRSASIKNEDDVILSFSMPFGKEIKESLPLMQMKTLIFNVICPAFTGFIRGPILNQVMR